MVVIEPAGRRIYLSETPYSARDLIRKSAICTWDPDKKRYWAGSTKEEQLRDLVAEINGIPKESIKEARSLGLSPDTDPQKVIQTLVDQGKQEAADRVKAAVERPKEQEDPHKINLTGKAEYRGRTYYMGFQTRDGQKVRLLTLPDKEGKYLDFWADLSQVTVVKTYEPRTSWNGMRGARSAEVKVYTTLGGIADFLKNPKKSRRVQCQECDAWHNQDENCPECGGC